MDDEDIRQFIAKGRQTLMSECLQMIRRIAGATPLDGEFGDEYDQARYALHALMHRLSADAVADQLAKVK